MVFLFPLNIPSMSAGNIKKHDKQMNIYNQFPTFHAIPIFKQIPSSSLSHTHFAQHIGAMISKLQISETEPKRKQKAEVGPSIQPQKQRLLEESMHWFPLSLYLLSTLLTLAVSFLSPSRVFMAPPLCLLTKTPSFLIFLIYEKILTLFFH